jgi:hypothetical protein
MMLKPDMVWWFALLRLPKVWKSGAARAASIVAFDTASMVAADKAGCSRRIPRGRDCS